MVDVALHAKGDLLLSETYSPPTERASEIRRQLRSECPTTAVSSSSKPELNRLISKDGRVLNSNQAEARFTLTEEDDVIILTVQLPK